MLGLLCLTKQTRLKICEKNVASNLLVFLLQYCFDILIVSVTYSFLHLFDKYLLKSSRHISTWDKALKDKEIVLVFW